MRLVSLSFYLLSNNLHKISLLRKSSFTLSFPRKLSSMKQTLVEANKKDPFEEISFDNRNLKTLPIDQNLNLSTRQVNNAIFSLVSPTPLKDPQLVAISPSAFEKIFDTTSPDFTNVKPKSTDYIDPNLQVLLETYFSGNKALPGSTNFEVLNLEFAGTDYKGYGYAHCYCGHQFGSFAGQLGDGAAIELGEVTTTKGDRLELQLKGAGLTPYSRGADGRKVLRSSIREFLASEALHFLGIPTTRALTCITSFETRVERDPYYDGNNLLEPCSVVCRMAPNFFRFGSFEIFKDGNIPAKSIPERSGPSAGNQDLKKKLLDHVLSYFPDIVPNHRPNNPTDEDYVLYFKTIQSLTIKLVAKWQSVGFVHGVLNTDNMSVMGLTIDYGPYGFMEYFDPNFVPNGSDHSARYSYQHQPDICKWNLEKLAQALDPLVPYARSLSILEGYRTEYQECFQKEMLGKLGLNPHSSSSSSTEDKALIDELFQCMESTYMDFTDFFVALTEYRQSLIESLQVDHKVGKTSLLDKLLSRCASPENVVSLMRRKFRIHKLTMNPSQVVQLSLMIEHHPDKLAEIFSGAPIEYIIEEVKAEKKKLDLLNRASDVIESMQSLSSKDKRTQDEGVWSSWVDKYQQRIGIETIKEDSLAHQDLVRTMQRLNPTFILRNWIAQDAIEEAEKKNFRPVRELLNMLYTPYNKEYSIFAESKCSPCEPRSSNSSGNSKEMSEYEIKYSQTSPDWASELLCTCSS